MFDIVSFVSDNLFQVSICMEMPKKGEKGAIMLKIT